MSVGCGGYAGFGVVEIEELKTLQSNYCIHLALMPARDSFHQAVKMALIKEQWQITHDPLSLRFGGVDFAIDLGAEKLIAVSSRVLLA